MITFKSKKPKGKYKKKKTGKSSSQSNETEITQLKDKDELEQEQLEKDLAFITENGLTIFEKHPIFLYVFSLYTQTRKVIYKIVKNKTARKKIAEVIDENLLCSLFNKETFMPDINKLLEEYKEVENAINQFHKQSIKDIAIENEAPWSDDFLKFLENTSLLYCLSMSSKGRRTLKRLMKKNSKIINMITFDALNSKRTNHAQLYKNTSSLYFLCSSSISLLKWMLKKDNNLINKISIEPLFALCADNGSSILSNASAFFWLNYYTAGTQIIKLLLKHYDYKEIASKITSENLCNLIAGKKYNNYSLLLALTFYKYGNELLKNFIEVNNDISKMITQDTFCIYYPTKNKHYKHYTPFLNLCCYVNTGVLDLLIKTNPNIAHMITQEALCNIVPKYLYSFEIKGVPALYFLCYFKQGRQTLAKLMEINDDFPNLITIDALCNRPTYACEVKENRPPVYFLTKTEFGMSLLLKILKSNPTLTSSHKIMKTLAYFAGFAKTNINIITKMYASYFTSNTLDLKDRPLYTSSYKFYVKFMRHNSYIVNVKNLSKNNHYLLDSSKQFSDTLDTPAKMVTIKKRISEIYYYANRNENLKDILTKVIFSFLTNSPHKFKKNEIKDLQYLFDFDITEENKDYDNLIQLFKEKIKDNISKEMKQHFHTVLICYFEQKMTENLIELSNNAELSTINHVVVDSCYKALYHASFLEDKKIAKNILHKFLFDLKRYVDGDDINKNKVNLWLEVFNNKQNNYTPNLIKSILLHQKRTILLGNDANTKAAIFNSIMHDEQRPSILEMYDINENENENVTKSKKRNNLKIFNLMKISKKKKTSKLNVSDNNLEKGVLQKLKKNKKLKKKKSSIDTNNTLIIQSENLELDTHNEDINQLNEIVAQHEKNLKTFYAKKI